MNAQKIIYHEVVDNEERKSTWNSRMVLLPRLTEIAPGSMESAKWDVENHWMVNFCVLPEDVDTAKALALELDGVYCEKKDAEHPEVKVIVEKLRALYEKGREEVSDLRRWDMGSRNLTLYSSSILLFRGMTDALESYEGNVLEAMCGHDSYFEPSQKRTIIALDYCERALRRYFHKSARRICCDLNQLATGCRFDFFNDNTFDAVSICFGYKYPKDIQSVMREFARVIKPGGVLSFMESHTHGHQSLFKRELDLEVMQDELLQSGFSSVKVKLVNGATANMPPEIHLTSVYHIEARK